MKDVQANNTIVFATPNPTNQTADSSRQPMTASIIESFPGQEFWLEFSELWHNSLHKPVFKSPHYIQYLADRYKDNLAILKFSKNGESKGMVFFRKENSMLRLLTDVKADHNFFVLHKSCTHEEIDEFFDCFLMTVKERRWTIQMRVLPLWASYSPAFIRAANNSGLFWNVSSRSVCPILEEESPKALFDKLNSSRELRYRVNRIKSQLGGEYEILTDAHDLDEWVRKFCTLHIKRWEGTRSPSRYEDASEQLFLKNCLMAWIQDQTLVRFAVKVNGERIAFVICLIQQNSLIHHSTAYDDDYYKYSPGKALILVIAEWMKNHNLNILDFGEGAEPYKYAYTNKERELNEISLSPFSNISFILRVKIKQILREQVSAHPGIKQFFVEKMKPLLRPKKQHEPQD